MTSRERLVEVIRVKGNCANSTWLDCGMDRPASEVCPLLDTTTSGMCNGIRNEEGYFMPTSPKRHDVRYNHALNLFIKLYGENNLLEILM